MQDNALVVIDIQNDITKNYKEIVGNINQAIRWAQDSDIPVIYIRHEFLNESARTFRPRTPGAELAGDLDIVSDHIFTKNKQNACTCSEFTDFLAEQGIEKLYLTGADATACVKSTCYNLAKSGFDVTVLSDCITSYDKKKIPEMLDYYRSKGARVAGLDEVTTAIG